MLGNKLTLTEARNQKLHVNGIGKSWKLKYLCILYQVYSVLF